jgi:molybdopterin biosynthesis enzyme
MGMRRCCHDAPVRDASLQRAIDLAREHAARTEPEHVPVGSAAGRRLAAAVTARADLPSEDASAMDGCAVRAADTPASRALAARRSGAPAGATLPRH